MFLVAQAGQLFGDTEAAALPSLLESGRLPARISGLPASGRALLAASMHAQLDAPVLAVCPDEAAAELFQKDLTALLGQDVPLLTARDYTFYTVESVSRQTEQKRLSALYALAAGTAPAVVCTVSGLLQRAMPKEKLLQAAFEIRDGTSLPPEDAEDALLRCGYLRTAQVEGPGQFSRRGGILDFFSPAYPQPVRVEFWGDDVDSMGFFDPESQRRTQPLDACRILPAAETLPPLYPGGSAALGEQLQKIAQRTAAKKDNDTAQKLAAAPTGKSSATTACSRRRIATWASCTTRLQRRWTILRRRRPCSSTSRRAAQSARRNTPRSCARMCPCSCAAARWPRTRRRFICRLPT